MFSDFDIDHWNRVAVLGPVTATNLFGFSDPIGSDDQNQRHQLSGHRRAQEQGGPGMVQSGRPDHRPLHDGDAHSDGGGSSSARSTCKCDSADDLDTVQDAVFAAMRKLHKVQPGQPDDVEIQQPGAVSAKRAGEQSHVSRFCSGSVAGISLLVGGIGIMNIMLVTVTERTREIGIRKAIGARDFDILSQFLHRSPADERRRGIDRDGAGVGTAWLVDNFTFFPDHRAVLQRHACAGRVCGGGDLFWVLSRHARPARSDRGAPI